MSVSFGGKRHVLPAPNLGVGGIAARKVAEAAGRAAERTREAVAVDGYPSRVWLRVPRAAEPCPCSHRPDAALDFDPGLTLGAASDSPFEVDSDAAEFDDVLAVSRGAGPADPTRPPPSPRWADALPAGDDDAPASVEDSDVMRLLLGNGRRCGICWGTGFIDGYRLWAGERLVCCAVDTLGTEIVESASTLDVDDDAPTPTLVGPGVGVWRVELPSTLHLIDSVRVLDGVAPATPEGVRLHIASNQDGPWFDPFNYFGELGAEAVSPDGRPETFWVRLTLDEGARASHVEIVARHHDLLPVQIPQIQQAAAAELIAPFVASEFELDPKVGFVERGTLIEVPARAGLLGTLWVVTDVQVKKTAQGLIFGVTGQCRNAQPTEVVAAALLDGTAFIGSFFSGHATRGLESTGAAMRAGLPDGTIDDSVAAVRRGSPQRTGGGAIEKTLTLGTSFERDDAREDELAGGFVDDWVYGDRMYVVKVNEYGQSEFEIDTAFMTVNGVDYSTPDITIDGTTVTWNGPFDLDEEDEVTVTLSTFLAVTYVPEHGQTSFLLARPMSAQRRQFARLEVNGIDYYPPKIDVRENEIVWRGSFNLAPTDKVRAIYSPVPIPAQTMLTSRVLETDAFFPAGIVED